MIRSPEDVEALLGTKMRLLEHEQLHVLLMNQKNRLIRDHTRQAGAEEDPQAFPCGGGLGPQDQRQGAVPVGDDEL